MSPIGSLTSTINWPSVTWGGFSHWPVPSGAAPDPAVDAFLDDGDAPVLVTLGTSSASGAGRAFATMAAGLDARGLRSLLLVGDEQNLAHVKGREGAFVFAPVARVLPRCRVAVVSGALGTLAAALSAGVQPQPSYDEQREERGRPRTNRVIG